MSWQANLVIVNNTSSNINLVHSILGDIAVITQNQTFSWSTTNTENNMSFKFWDEPNIFYLESVFNFGESMITYINRGVLPAEKQDIKLTVTSDSDVIFEQFNGLGGMNFLFDLFEGGKTITFKYDLNTNPLPLSTNLDPIDL